MKSVSRLDALSDFYVKSNVTLSLEDNKIRKKSSDEMKGQWAIEQFENAATSLGLMKFIKPLGAGGIEVPIIEDINVYFEKELEGDRETLRHLTKVMPLKERRMQDLLAQVERMELELETARSKVISSPLKDEKSKGSTVATKGQQQQKQTSSVVPLPLPQSLPEIRELEIEHNALMVAWEKAEEAYIIVIDKIKHINNEASKRAKKQFEEDSDALTEVKNAFSKLKNHLQSIFKKFDLLEETCRQRASHSIDPYEVGDMRRVYANMVNKYRSDDELGVLASLVAFMREEQTEGKTLNQFARVIEDYYLNLTRMKVETISIGDLAALVLLKGMTEPLRKQFFKDEKLISLSAAALNSEEDDEMLGDSRSVISSSSIRKKSLFDRTRAFVQTQEELLDIADKFSSVKDRKIDRSDRQNDKNKDVEIRDILAVEEAQPKKKGVCFSFEANGTCKYGDKCHFSHSKGNPSKAAGSAKDAKTPAPKPAPASAVDSQKAGGADQKQGQQKKGAHDDLFDSFNLHVSVTEDVNVCTSTVVDRDIDLRLAWDTAASTNVAGDPRIATENVRMNVTGKVARGVGGTQKILKVADSPVMGEKDFIVFDGPPKGIPNLLSVPKASKEEQSMFIFLPKGAVRIKFNAEDMRTLSMMTQRAVEENRFLGRAEMEEGLYVQNFGERNVLPKGNAEDSFVVSTYSGRYVTDNMDGIIGMLLSSGISASSLRHAAEFRNIKGLPPGLDIATIDKYMATVGLDQDQLTASIAKARISTPPDFVKETTEIPGEIIELDNVDPSFSRLLSSSEHKKTVVKSFGGYKDAVIAVDMASGYVHGPKGRISKKNPHLVLESFVKDWITRWRNLKCIKTDKEFVTELSLECVKNIKMSTKMDIKISQAVPGEHNKGLAAIEGVNRWILESGQANMNRAKVHVKNGDITEEEHKKMWFHALRLAVIASNTKPSNVNDFISRFQEGTNEVFNLAIYPMLPFSIKIVGRKLLYDEDGRGEVGLYMGPSLLVRGGILFYSLETRSFSAKYSFLARMHMPILSDLDIERSMEMLYGGLVDITVESDLPAATEANGDNVEEPSDEEINQDDPLPIEDVVENAAKDVAKTAVTDEIEDKLPQISEYIPSVTTAKIGDQNIDTGKRGKIKAVSPFRGDSITVVNEIGLPAKPFSIFEPSDPYRKQYKPSTRLKRNVETAARNTASILSIDVTKVDRPVVPPRTLIRRSGVNDPWFKSRKREYQKLVEENSFKKLEKGDNGRVIIPKDSIIMRFLEIYEFKWKEDPETHVMRWLECTRSVVDGSSDKRKDCFYAETPSRTVFLLMMSLSATMGMYSLAADAVRAYLNAESIDNNLVVILPDDVIMMDLGLEKYMKLDKGVYGSRSGALSYEIWFDKKAVIERQFQKCLIARSVYIKEVNGTVIRKYRHSDDCIDFCENEETLINECSELSKIIRLSDWVKPEKFVGISIEYGDRVVLLRQNEYIMEVEAEFHNLIIQYNRKRRARNTRLPANALDDDSNFTEEQLKLLDDDMASEYRSLVGAMNWIASLRMDCKFPQHVVAGRMKSPRKWDLFCAIWYLEYVIFTADYPLVLGGPVIDPQGSSDASFGTMREKRSVKAHLVRTCPLSGAILASTDTIKIATTSVWDCEVQAASDLVDSLQYVMNLCEDLRFKTENNRICQLDSQSARDWYLSSKINAKSRHLQIKYYHTKHSVQEGLVNLEFIEGEDNDSDLNTKVCGIARTRKLTRKMLGHWLVLGQGFRGIIELNKEEEKEHYQHFSK